MGALSVLAIAAMAPPASAATREDVVAGALSGVATVTTGDALGTAFALDNGMVLTNAHVVGDADTVQVRNADGETADARVVAIDRERDVARLETRLRLTGLRRAPDPARAGQDVLIIGAPDGLSGTVTRGIVSATDREVNGMPMIQSDAAANPGNSGGPMLDAQGRVLGITTAKRESAEGIAFAIPIDVAIGAVGADPPGPRRDEASSGPGGLLQALVIVLLLALLGLAVALLVRRRRPETVMPPEPVVAAPPPPPAPAPELEEPVVIVRRDPVVVRRHERAGGPN